MIEFESLNTIEPKTPEESEEAGEAAETSQPPEPGGKRSSRTSWRTASRAGRKLRRSAAEAGIEIGPRQVSRYLKILTEKGLLRREGKRYVPTDLETPRAPGYFVTGKDFERLVPDQTKAGQQPPHGLY